MEADLVRSHFLKRIVFAGMVLGVLGTTASAAPACLRMEFVVVDDQGPRAITEPDGNVLHLKAVPLLTMADFTGANVTLTENQIVLNIDLDQKGAQRIQQFSKYNVGKRIAFIVDGQVVKTANILDPIQFNGFLVGPLDGTKANALADAINKDAAHMDHAAAACQGKL